MTDPDATPPLGTPVPSAAPEPARDRGGHHAPRVQGGTLPGLEAIDDARYAIERARELFRVCRVPRADASWPGLRVHLIAAETSLTRRVLRPDDIEAPALLQEVRRYLGRHP